MVSIRGPLGGGGGKGGLLPVARAAEGRGLLCAEEAVVDASYAEMEMLDAPAAAARSCTLLTRMSSRSAFQSISSLSLLHPLHP